MLSSDILERQLLDALPISAYVLDLDGRVAGVHQPATRFGRSAALPTSLGDDARDRHLWDLAPDLFPRDQLERAMFLLRTGRAPIAHWEIARGSDTDSHALLVQLTPLHDESHAVTGFVASAIDISASHRVHAAAAAVGAALGRTTDLDRVFQETAQHLRQLLRPDTIVIALVDRSHSPVGAHVAYDSGTDEDRRTTERRFTADWRDALERGEPHTRRTDSTWALTVPLVGSDGPVGVVSLAGDDAASPEQLTDARALLAGIAPHLTAAIERVNSISRTEHRQRIHAIGEIASGVAQELRNPIFGISSAAQLLRFRAREDPVMEKNVGRILREVERLNRMVTTLVELGRPISLKRSPGDPDAIWDDVFEVERGRLESRAVAVRRTRADPHVIIPIDAEQLAQAFGSILSNAVEAAPEATDIVLASTTLPNGAWRCRLTNGGDPIPADLLPHVLDPFVSTKPGSSGTGLAHTRRIVEEHGGSISIESTPESGTTVTVTIPAR